MIDTNTHLHVLPPKDFNVKSPKAYIKSTISTLSQEGADTTTLSGVAKVVRGIAQILQTAFSILKVVIAPLSFFADVIKIADGFKKAKDLGDQISRDVSSEKSQQSKEALQAERILKAASNATGVAIAALTVFKVLDAIGLIKLGKFIASLGKIPVIGIIAKAFPLSSLLSALDIFKSANEIGASAIKLDTIRKTMNHMSQKEDHWKATVTSELFAQTQAETATSKLERNKNALEKAQVAVEKTGNKMQVRIKAFEDFKANRAKEREDIKYQSLLRRIFKKIEFFFKDLWTSSETRKLRKAYNKHEAAWKNYKNLNNAITKAQTKKTFWESRKTVKAQDPADSATLKDYQEAKLNKWHIKQVNLRWDIVKEAMGIFISTLVIAASVASIVLFATGVGSFPAALTLTGVFLFISAMGLGLHFFRKYKTNTATHSISTPKLAAAAA